MPTVYFSHGKESGPWGSKIRYLADRAEALGFAVESIDYRGIESPDDRVALLREQLAGEADPAQVVLAGSSMGGYVSTVVAADYPAAGLFLMAPALYMPGYEVQDYPIAAAEVSVVHGWGDDIIPPENAIRFARTARHALQLINSDHRLNDSLDRVGGCFCDLLVRCFGSNG